MSDHHPNGEDIARMLREQGPVQAPPDLADEVMRQVRTEPQERPKPARRFRLPQLRSVLVPAVGLAAAAGLVIGIARLGHTGSSSSAGGGASSAAVEHSSSGAAGPANGGQGQSSVPKASARVLARGEFAVSADSAKTLTRYGVMRPPISRSAGESATAPHAQAIRRPYTLTVPANRYAPALNRLRVLSAEHRQHRHEPTVVVILRRKP